MYPLLLREGAAGWRTGKAAIAQHYFDDQLDIHHVFPQAWCRNVGIQCDSIVNKTPLSARTNRVIGGGAPREYSGPLEHYADISAELPDSYIGNPPHRPCPLAGQRLLSLR